MNCVAAHSVFDAAGFDTLWSSVLANWRPVDDRLILDTWIVVVVLSSRGRASRDFFPGDDGSSAELSFPTAVQTPVIVEDPLPRLVVCLPAWGGQEQIPAKPEDFHHASQNFEGSVYLAALPKSLSYLPDFCHHRKDTVILFVVSIFSYYERP